MKEFTIYIPQLRDDNKCRHARHVWEWLERELLRQFGGFTYAGQVSGQWKDEMGKAIIDTSRVYKVATKDDTQLRGLVQCCKVRFRQHCIYLATTATQVELVY